MTRRVEIVNNDAYVFSPDDQPLLGQRFWAIVRARIIDELTGHPPLSAITIESDALHLVPRVASDGLVGLVGIPQQVFPALATQNYPPLMVKVIAIGYIPVNTAFLISQDHDFPSTFTPPPIAELSLHRNPIVIAGRVVHSSGNGTTPLSGAVVRVTGVWRKSPPANMTVASDPPDLVSLHSPLYSDRGASTGQLTLGNLPVSMGDDKLLLNDVSEGANLVRLSNQQNLSPGDILLIDSDQPDIAEYIAIKTITGAGTVTQTATITLDYPLLHSHRRNARVQKVNPQPLGPPKQFAQEALAGDTCVFLDNVIGLTNGNQVRITGGPNPAEYHHVSLFSTISDAEGYYRLPPLSRVAQLEIRAEHGALIPVQMEFRPDYTLLENRLDFVFR